VLTIIRKKLLKNLRKKFGKNLQTMRKFANDEKIFIDKVIERIYNQIKGNN
jgi:3-methyladenine DNA glycosylase AlkC